MNEAQAAVVWLYTKLAADPDLAELVSDRIFELEAAEGAPFPLVIFSLNSASDRIVMGADLRLHTRLTFLVKGITSDPGSMAPADALAGAIDAALLGQSGTAVIDGTTYAIRGCYRVQPLRYREGTGDTRYNHVGGLYRLHVQDL